MPIISHLPLKNGVSPSKLLLSVDKQSQTKTILVYLCQKFPHISKENWQKRFENQQIFVAFNCGFLALHADDICQNYQGQMIYYYRDLDNEVLVPFAHEIVFENEHVMVVDKPHFLTISPSGNHVQQTLLTRLKDETNNGELTPIHRLDKETAGLVLFCKQKKHRHDYQSLFVNQTIKKIYHAIAPFNANLLFPLLVKLHLQRGNPFYTMQVIDDKNHNSETWINILQVDNKKQWAKYELHPKTGKLHQLRVHLNHLGLPIKNDPYYPKICHRSDGDFDNPLQLLAKSLAFIDPVIGEYYHFVSKRQLVLSQS